MSNCLSYPSLKVTELFTELDNQLFYILALLEIGFLRYCFCGYSNTDIGALWKLMQFFGQCLVKILNHILSNTVIPHFRYRGTYRHTDRHIDRQVERYLQIKWYILMHFCEQCLMKTMNLILTNTVLPQFRYRQT